MYINIKSIKLFDCLQCLSFPSMYENDKIRLISMFNLFCSFCRGCANNKCGLTRLINEKTSHRNDPFV